MKLFDDAGHRDHLVHFVQNIAVVGLRRAEYRITVASAKDVTTARSMSSSLVELEVPG